MLLLTGLSPSSLTMLHLRADVSDDTAPHTGFTPCSMDDFDRFMRDALKANGYGK